MTNAMNNPNLINLIIKSKPIQILAHLALILNSTSQNIHIKYLFFTTIVIKHDACKFHNIILL